MSTVKEIESAIQRLSGQEMREIYEWLENALEDQMELREDFQKRIETSERELVEGKRPRLRQP